MSCSCGVGQAAAQGISGQVVAIGSDLQLTLRGEMKRQYRVRIADIAVPASGQLHAADAERLVVELCLKRQGSVKVLRTDNQRKNLGRVWCGGADVALELVRRGLAWRSDPGSGDQEMQIAEYEAKAQGIGVWSAESAPGAGNRR